MGQHSILHTSDGFSAFLSIFAQTIQDLIVTAFTGHSAPLSDDEWQRPIRRKYALPGSNELEEEMEIHYQRLEQTTGINFRD